MERTRAELMRTGWAKNETEAQMMIDAKTLAAAQTQLKMAFVQAFEPLVSWLDRQIRRSPRLHSWLSKPLIRR